nr:alpha/beta hydrolase [Alphaproteobacteria bacterium]
ILGENDRMTAPKRAKGIIANAAETAIVPNAGHMVHVEAAPAVRTLMIDFLRPLSHQLAKG